MLLPEIYNSLGAMHGTIMIFLGIVPLAVGAFGNYFVPLQIGAPDMAIPKLNAASYWSYFVGGVVMMSSFFTADQQVLMRDIFKGMTNPDWLDRWDQQLKDDVG